MSVCLSACLPLPTIIKSDRYRFSLLAVFGLLKPHWLVSYVSNTEHCAQHHVRTRYANRLVDLSCHQERGGSYVLVVVSVLDPYSLSLNRWYVLAALSVVLALYRSTGGTYLWLSVILPFYRRRYIPKEYITRGARAENHCDTPRSKRIPSDQRSAHP